MTGKDGGVFKRVVNSAGLLVGAAVMAVALLLVGCGPDPARVSPAVGPTTADVGAQVYGANCAICHGARGEGGVGPRLAGGVVVADFPGAADEIGLVADGKGTMPAGRKRLSPAQIQAVVEYTRTRLGR